jgi:hypothetical protein
MVEVVRAPGADEAAASRLLDELARRTEWKWELTADGRRFWFSDPAVGVGEAADAVARELGVLAPGWQQHVALRV